MVMLIVNYDGVWEDVDFNPKTIFLLAVTPKDTLKTLSDKICDRFGLNCDAVDMKFSTLLSGTVVQMNEWAVRLCRSVPPYKNICSESDFVNRCCDSLKDLLDVTIEYKKVVERNEARSRSRSTVVESRVAELERDVYRLKNTKSTSLVDRLRRQEGCRSSEAIKLLLDEFIALNEVKKKNASKKIAGRISLEARVDQLETDVETLKRIDKPRKAVSLRDRFNRRRRPFSLKDLTSTSRNFL
ncbi:hypothetical protein LWI29_031153 [Acer saccharum]|uniref:Uncharacterized protein n=1 Tax=Acer saccharum TaxID=4024 RepID=A0AA39SGQ1_ACESA|nr:hypothetical protein LWI29_031153 [Acer saccharum]